MAGDPIPPPQSLPNPKPINPVYTVSNIQHKVRVLDGVKVTYSSWVKLFKLHALGFEVLHHIDGTSAPAETDPDYTSWKKIDAIVLQWIYGTMRDDLLHRILETESTAYEAWIRLQNLFLTLRSMPSLDAYCQRLKDLADQLNDVGNTVNDQKLVLQLVCGLPSEYDTTTANINQSLPSFDTARSMLQLEYHRQQARDDQTSNPVLITTPNNQTDYLSSRDSTHRIPRGDNRRNQNRDGERYRSERDQNQNRDFLSHQICGHDAASLAEEQSIKICCTDSVLEQHIGHIPELTSIPLLISLSRVGSLSSRVRQ